MSLLAIDVGGTEIKYGLIDHDYVISNRNFIKTADDNLQVFADTIYAIFSQFNDVEAIVMSLPGFVDVYSGMHRGGGCFKSFYMQNIKELIESVCHCPCFVDNDGKSATIAEYYLGNLRGCKDCAVFLIGTGVGGGLIINSHLVRGRNFTAGEYSFLNVDINDSGMATLADYCSTRSLLSLYNDINGDHIKSGRVFFMRFADGDEAAIRALDIFCDYIAKEILNLGILLNVEKVAVGGGISVQDVLIAKIKEKLECLALNVYFKEIGYNPFIPEVVNCRFYNDANLLGVAYEYWHGFKEV